MAGRVSASFDGGGPMLQAPTAALHRSASSSRPNHPSRPSSPEPDLTHMFWHPAENRPKTLYDIDPDTDFMLDIKTARALQRQCRERLDIYDQLERAVKDEQARKNPAWWRRWIARWLCCCGCGGVEVGLGYSSERERWKELLRMAWAYVHGVVWTKWFLEVFMHFRAVWLVLKMGFGVVKPSLSRWF